MKKSTNELFNEIMTAKDYESFRRENADNFTCMKLDRALMAKMEEKKLTKSDVIKGSGMAKTYAYQIFDGKKANPHIDKVLLLCIGMGLSIEETQNLLKVTGYRMLSPRDQRDSYICYAIKNRMNIIDINLGLQELNLKILE